MSYLAHLRDKVIYSQLPRILIDGFDKLGIQIRVIYVIQEGMTGDVCHRPENSLEGYEIGFVGREALAEMAKAPYRPIREKDLERRLKDGNLCLAAKRDG